MRSFGTGLFLKAALLNHSCEPNACAIFEGNVLRVKVIKKKGISDGEAITISYIELGASTATRHMQLNERYCFTCDCEACRPPKSLDRDAKLMEKKDSIATLDVEKYETLTRLAKDKLAKGGKENKKEAVVVLEKAYATEVEVLGKLNESILECAQLLLTNYIDLQKFEQALTYSRVALDFYEFCYPPFYPLLGLSYFMHGKLLWVNAQLENSAKRALEMFQKAYSILLMTHGQSSSVVKQLVDFIQQAQGAVGAHLKK